VRGVVVVLVCYAGADALSSWTLQGVAKTTSRFGWWSDNNYQLP